TFPQMTLLRSSSASSSAARELSVHFFLSRAPTGKVRERTSVHSFCFLGFVSQARFRTLVEHRHKASCLLVFSNLGDACSAVHVLRDFQPQSGFCFTPCLLLSSIPAPLQFFFSNRKENRSKYLVDACELMDSSSIRSAQKNAHHSLSMSFLRFSLL